MPMVMKVEHLHTTLGQASPACSMRQQHITPRAAQPLVPRALPGTSQGRQQNSYEEQQRKGTHTEKEGGRRAGKQLPKDNVFL